MVFKKRGIETYDYTLLQKKGFIEKPKEIVKSQVNSRGYFDFSKSESQSNSQSQESNPLSFFDNFSAAQNQTPEPQQNTSLANPEVAVKLENLEYQLERLSEKLAQIEEKLARFEEKVL